MRDANTCVCVSVLSAFGQKHDVKTDDSHKGFTFTMREWLKLQTPQQATLWRVVLTDCKVVGFYNSAGRTVISPFIFLLQTLHVHTRCVLSVW